MITRRRSNYQENGSSRVETELLPEQMFDPSRKKDGVVAIHPFRMGLTGALGVLLALLIGAVITQLTTVLIYIGLALFVALGLDPLVSYLEKRMKRGLAIALVFLVVIGVFVGLLFAVVPVLVDQGTKLIQDLPSIVDNVSKSDFVMGLQHQFAGVVNIDAAIDGAVSFLQNPNNLLNIGGGVLAVGAGVASGVTGAVIVLILTLYFLASLHSIKRVTYRFVARGARPQFVALSDEITSSIGRYVVGQVSLALINGVASLIVLSIIGAPVPFLLAFLAFLASLVPLVGTIAGAVVICLVCLFASPLTALVAAIWYLIYMQIEAYVLSPRIMKKAVAVPGAIVVIAAVAGGAIGGVLGALVAIPFAASAIIIVQKVVFPRQDAKT